MSIATGRTGGFLSWLRGLFGVLHRNEKSPAIAKTLGIINKMIDDLEVNRKKMEERYSDLSRKAKEAASRGDKKSQEIFLNEVEEILRYMGLIDHAIHSLTQIKLRLETMMEVGDTLDQMPVIMGQLARLREMLAPLAPDVLQHMSELEREVANIITSTSIPDVYKANKLERNKEATSSIDYASLLEELRPPRETPKRIPVYANNMNRVSIRVIKKWLLEEIMRTNGFLDIDAFTRKYCVPKQVVLEALNQLSEEGRIIIKR